MGRFGKSKFGLVGQGNDILVTPDGQMHTVMTTKVDTGNSSIIPLAIGGVFTGTSKDVLDFSVMGIAVWADQESAVNGLSVEFSPDDTNWDHCDVYTIPANIGKIFTIQPAAKYFRIVYTNGAVGQTAFRMQILLHKAYVKPSSHRIQDSIIDDDDAELTKAVITGRNPGGNFINFEATTKGNFKCSLEELENDVSINSNKQLKVSLLDATGRVQAFDATFPVPVVQELEHGEIHEGDHYYIEDFTTLGDDGTLELCVTTPDTAKETHIVWAFAASAEMELEVFRKADVDADGTLVVQQNNNHKYSWVGTHTPAGASATVLTDTTQDWTTDELVGHRVYNITDGSWGTVVSNTATTVTVDDLIGGTGDNFEQNDQYEINNSCLLIEAGCTINSAGISISGVSSGSSLTPSKGVPGGTARTDEIVLDRNTTYIFIFTSRLAANVLSYKGTWYEHTPD